MKASDEMLSEKLDTVIVLLKHLLVLELSKGGVTHAEIGKHAKIATATVGKLLRGYKREE
jgi:hypothetical protein